MRAVYLSFFPNYRVPTSIVGTREHVNSRQLRKDLRDFAAARKTRGVYGLIDPESGVTRYVGSSDHIEKRYAQHIDRKMDCAVREKNYWIGDLLSKGKLPTLQILEEVFYASNLLVVEKHWIEGIELLGGADLNYTHTERVIRAPIQQKHCTT